MNEADRVKDMLADVYPELGSYQAFTETGRTSARMPAVAGTRNLERFLTSEDHHSLRMIQASFAFLAPSWRYILGGAFSAKVWGHPDGNSAGMYTERRKASFEKLKVTGHRILAELGRDLSMVQDPTKQHAYIPDDAPVEALVDAVCADVDGILTRVKLARMVAGLEGKDR